MKTHLDMDKIANTLGAERRGKVRVSGGYFGALELAADIQRRFRIPNGGGRPSDPTWTEKRLVGLSAATLSRLQDLAHQIRESHSIHLNSMQIASLLIEKKLNEIHGAKQLVEEFERTRIQPIGKKRSNKRLRRKGDLKAGKRLSQGGGRSD